ncbi:polymeric immunoglobulin receptor-like [Scomber scombrus]|uniref:polymeric immunoglobulin receptor-like n=1 Tax=Scomber scombrus TaxID=13677 RepID=UPI002DD7CA50|nr:polymeric immunoglobulin receptor-like [Scomber scombrus]
MMHLLHLLLVFIVSGGALCSIPIFTKNEGEHLSFGCFFNSSESNKLFIRRGAGGEQLLLETGGLTAESGKYSINYDSDINLFYVKIEQLDRSDSGRYRCGLGNAASPDPLREFELRVTDVMCDANSTLSSGVSVCSEAVSFKVRCSFPSAGLFPLFFCKDSCRKQDVLIETSQSTAERGRYRIDYDKNGVFYVTIATLTKSDSGLYSCGVDRTSASNPCLRFELRVTDANQPLSSPGMCMPATAPPPVSTLPATAPPPVSTLPATAPPPVSTLPAAPHTAAQHSDTQQQSQTTGFLLPLVGFLLVLLVLVAGSLLLYRKTRRHSCEVNAAESNSESIECATFQPAADPQQGPV